MRTKFWQNYFLGKGFAKTSAHLFLNSDVASGGGGVWGGMRAGFASTSFGKNLAAKFINTMMDYSITLSSNTSKC